MKLTAKSPQDQVENRPGWVEFLVSLAMALGPWETRDFEVIPAPKAYLDALKKACEKVVRVILRGYYGKPDHYDVTVRERNGHILIVVQNPL